MGPTNVHCPPLIRWSNVCHYPVNSDRQHPYVLLNFKKKVKKKKGKRKTSYAGLFICIQMPSFKKKKINMFDIIISYISQFN